jgi:hypothetical protein
MSETWPPPDQLYANEKPGIRYYLILAALPLLPLELDRQAYHQEALEIRNHFDDLMQLAKNHIAEGKHALVVEIFEKLVESGYDQIYPYEYLKKYYADSGDQEQEERIRTEFRCLVETIQRRGINRQDLVALLESFVSDETV